MLCIAGRSMILNSCTQTSLVDNYLLQQWGVWLCVLLTSTCIL